MAEQKKPRYVYRPEGVQHFIESSISDLARPDEEDVVKVTVRIPVPVAIRLDKLAEDLKSTRSGLAGQLLENAIADSEKEMDAVGYPGYEHMRFMEMPEEVK